ncbi:uncharacterized protein [Haliotis cracherodii]|uniref:uncharacterized protein n=1 Tax=Haliotis cracherodii TaxID=6455 RepID=UPI0039E9C363
MAPDSKHRKDPTDPHLKFLTRSRRLISTTRDHMNNVGRISAEIHVLSQSILADHDEFIRARSAQNGNSDPVEDPSIQREISFEVSNASENEANDQPVTRFTENTLKVPIRYPDIHSGGFHRPQKDQGPSIRKHKHRNTHDKLPQINKHSVTAVPQAAASIYRNPQIPYVPHKLLPKVKPEPVAVYKEVNSNRHPVARLKLHRLKVEDKTDTLPTITRNNVDRKYVSDKKPRKEVVANKLPVIKHQLPVYRAPAQIMQPPGYAPRIEARLPVDVKVKDTTVSEPQNNADIKRNSAMQRNVLPEVAVKHPTPQGRVPTGRVPRINRLQLKSALLQSGEKVELSVNGKKLNELILLGRETRKESSATPRTSTYRPESKKKLKRKETVILPKVNPGPSFSPDFKPSKRYHRPSYMITCPVPVCHLAPTPSLESYMSLSPMPYIHQMTLTPRQTMLLSGSPGNLTSHSRPGSLIRESPLVVTKLPKIPASGEGAT